MYNTFAVKYVQKQCCYQSMSNCIWSNYTVKWARISVHVLQIHVHCLGVQILNGHRPYISHNYGIYLHVMSQPIVITALDQLWWGEKHLRTLNTSKPATAWTGSMKVRLKIIKTHHLVWWITISSVPCRSGARIWFQEKDSMDPTWFVSTVQAGGCGVKVWWMFSWLTPYCHWSTVWMSQPIRGLLLITNIPLWPHVSCFIMANSRMIICHDTKHRLCLTGSMR